MRLTLNPSYPSVSECYELSYSIPILCIINTDGGFACNCTSSVNANGASSEPLFCKVMRTEYQRKTRGQPYTDRS